MSVTRTLKARHAVVFASLFVLAVCNTVSIRADSFLLPDTEVTGLKSQTNHVSYRLYVGLPADYKSSDAHYPVLYVLDADYAFPITQTIVKHMSERKLIVVGIAYEAANQYQSDSYRLNRTRDYTPRFAATGGYGGQYQKVSGGGPKFLEFVQKELIPRIDHDYRTIPGLRGLVGHSYGGLFANWLLLTASETFSRYIIVSPSLWYLDRFMFDVEKESTVAPHARVYMAVGSREGNAQHDMVADLERMANAFGRRPALEVKHEVFDDETHDSVFPTAVSRGIRFVFEGD